MVVALGSVLGAIEEVVDDLREEGVRIGALGITCFRPWPIAEVRDALGRATRVIVVEKAFAVGAGGIVGQNTRLALGPAAGHRVRRRGRPRWPPGDPGVPARARRRRAGRPARRPGLHFLDLDTGLVARRARPDRRPAARVPTPNTCSARSGSPGPRPTEQQESPHDFPGDQALPGRHVRRRQPAARPSRCAPCRPARTGRTRSPRGTAPARAAARCSAPATSSTPRCGPPAATWSPSTPPAAWRCSRRRTRSRRGRSRGCTRCSATPPRWPAGSPPRCGPPAHDHTRVVGQAGDGGTVDIGFGALSGMFERNDDVLFVCYDNEGYMNTGVQRSGATPPAARTANTKAVGPEPGNAVRPGQERAADRDGPRDPVRRHRHRRRPARPRGQGRRRR